MRVASAACLAALASTASAFTATVRPSVARHYFATSTTLNMAEKLSQDELKKMVGYKSVDDYVKSGMVVGLGTGSTAYFAVERVGVGVGGCRCKWCRRRRSRQLRTLRTLLSELNGGADQGTAAGTTPAHIAAAHDSVAALRLLRARRSPLWRRDASGRTPLDVAREARRGASRFVQRLLLLGKPAPT